jgi:hypothetical protein
LSAARRSLFNFAKYRRLEMNQGVLATSLQFPELVIASRDDQFARNVEANTRVS